MQETQRDDIFRKTWVNIIGKVTSKTRKKHNISFLSQLHIEISKSSPQSAIGSVGSPTLPLAPTVFQTFLRPWEADNRPPPPLPGRARVKSTE